MPDLRQLRAFVMVAEELNFTRAATRLHLAQQAVSKAVRQLERELGVDLLERTTREVRLTAAGATLLDSGREVLAAADAAFARARDVGLDLAGTVRVGVSPAIGQRVRDEVTAAVRAGAQEVSVSLIEVRPREVERLLCDRAVDMVLARTTPNGGGFDSAALRPTAAAVAVPLGHRLAEAPVVAIADLDGERLLTWGALGTLTSSQSSRA
jgi:DNA-binding transcriptional LysR family regulator